MKFKRTELTNRTIIYIYQRYDSMFHIRLNRTSKLFSYFIIHRDQKVVRGVSREKFNQQLSVTETDLYKAVYCGT